MAEPISHDLPALIPPKTAPTLPHIAATQGTATKRVLKKRNRKIGTCTNCRSRKVGCDRGQTCSHCKIKSLQCVYIEDPSELDKAPARVVRKRNRKVKVCLNCRERKIPCNQRKPCRSCEDGQIRCTYLPFTKADVLQHDQEQASTGSVPNDHDLQQSVNVETDMDVRELPSELVFGGHPEEAAYGRHGEQSSANDYSTTNLYGYATAQDQPQHRHQHPYGTLNRLPGSRYHHQDNTAYGYTVGESQVRHFGRNNQGEGNVRGRAGTAEDRSQHYLPPISTSFQTEQRVPYNYSPLLPSPHTPVYTQPIRNHPQPLYSPQRFLIDPTFAYQESPNDASGPRETNVQAEPDIGKLETATKDPISNEDQQQSLDDLGAGAINESPPQPDTVPWYRRLGAGLTLMKS